MQPPLPLVELGALLPLAWEHVAPRSRAEAVAELARLMVRLVHPAAGEEHSHDRSHP
jgi:hypothetical protein